MSNILIVHLTSGMEVLSDVEDKGDTLLLKHPTHIAVGHNPQTGQVDVHMAPLLPLGAHKEITIPKTSVLFSYEPVTDIKNKFNSLFGSKLIVPNNAGEIIKP